MAAIETGRNSISIEIEPTYVESIEDRLLKDKAHSTQVHIHRSEKAYVLLRRRVRPGFAWHDHKEGEEGVRPNRDCRDRPSSYAESLHDPKTTLVV